MSELRRAWLDICPGERRGVVTLDGKPERLMIERDGEPPYPRLGERWRLRLRERSPDRREAFVDLGEGASGLIRLPADASLAEGALLEAEVAAEPQAGKAARLALIGPAQDGAVGRIASGPTLEARLAALAPSHPVERGWAAREVADFAEESALATIYRLKGGVSLSIEPTRAMTVIDVDFAASGEGGKRALDANLRALGNAARLLRLKALGGAVAIDLIGFPKSAGALLGEARTALALDGPDVTILPPNRLGVMMLSLPRRERPVAEALLGPDGELSPRSRAQRLVRDLDREGRADPGARLRAICPPEVAAALAPLAAQLGPRFHAVAAPGTSAAAAHIERL